MIKNQKKFFWLLIFMFDLLLFLYAINTNSIVLMIVVAIIGGVIHFKGDNILFSEFNKRQEQKRIELDKRLKQIRERKARKNDRKIFVRR